MCNRWYGKDPCAHIKDLSLCVALCLQPSITTLCEIISRGDKLLEALCQNIGNLMFKNISTKADCTRTTLHQTPSLLNVHPQTWKLASVTLPFLVPLHWVVICIREIYPPKPDFDELLDKTYLTTSDDQILQWARCAWWDQKAQTSSFKQIAEHSSHVSTLATIWTWI